MTTCLLKKYALFFASITLAFLLYLLPANIVQAENIGSCKTAYSQYRVLAIKNDTSALSATTCVLSVAGQDKTFTFKEVRSGSTDLYLVNTLDSSDGLILTGTTYRVINYSTGQVVTPNLSPDTGTKGATDTAAKPPENKNETAGLCDNVFDKTGLIPGINGTGLGICMAGIIYVFAVGITTPFAYLGASIFEVMVPISLSSDVFASPAIAQGWTVMRDVANIGFLFILIYIAFSVMLDNFSLEMKKALTYVIVIALVVNFSFFISRLIIDAGNLMGLTFYKAINAPESIAGYKAAQAQGQITVAGAKIIPPKALTETFMSGINLQKIIGTDQFKTFAEKARPGFLTALIIMSFIFLTMGAMLAILAYIFLYASVKLIIRIVVLWFTIILSPLAFVAWILPGTSSLAHKWWDTHLKNALFPAAFLFGLYVIALVIAGQESLYAAQWDDVFKTLNTLGTNPQAGASTLQTLAVGMIMVAIRCIFLVVMLLGALKIADMFGDEGAGVAKGFANWAAKRPMSFLARRGPAFAGGYTFQKTVGRTFAGADESLKKSRFGNTWLGYRLRKNVTSPIAGASLGGAQSRTAYLEHHEEEHKEREAGYQDISNRELLRRASDPVAWGLMAAPAQAAAQARIKGFRKRELEALDADEVRSIAHLLSEDQVKELQKSDHYTDQQKDSFKTSWDNRGTYRGPLPGQTGNFGSPDAAINKADDIVREIRRLTSTLTMRAASGRFTPGTLVIKDNVSDEIRELEAHADTIATNLEVKKAALITAATPAAIAALQGEIGNLHVEKRNSEKIIEQLKKLEEERKKIPAVVGAGGGATTSAGEFRTRP